MYFVLDAQPYLVELPVPEPGRQELKGERTLLAEQFQREKILERVVIPAFVVLKAERAMSPSSVFEIFVAWCFVFMIRQTNVRAHGDSMRAEGAAVSAVLRPDRRA